MADRIIDRVPEEVPPIPEVLVKVLLFTLGEAREKLEKGEVVVPYTALVVKDNLFIESHPGNTTEECFNYARHTVRGARGADAYAFCYDGYLDTNEGQKDALISEGGIPGEDIGYAICQLYTVDESGKVTFTSEPAYIGEAPNFMAELKESSAYDEDEIEERYREDDEPSEKDSEPLEDAPQSEADKAIESEIAEKTPQEISELLQEVADTMHTTPPSMN